MQRLVGGGGFNVVGYRLDGVVPDPVAGINGGLVAIGLTQFAAVEDPATNLDSSERLVRAAAAKGAQVICLQEMCSTLYFCRSEDPALFRYAEAIPGDIAAVAKLEVLVPLLDRETESRDPAAAAAVLAATAAAPGPAGVADAVLALDAVYSCP